MGRTTSPTLSVYFPESLVLPLPFAYNNISLDLLLVENQIMLLGTLLISIALAFLLIASRPILGLRSHLTKRQKQPVWIEDPHFMESFGELYQDLESETNKHLLDSYDQKTPHVTHFCFLVHGYAGFSKDLSYLETVMRLMAEQQKLELIKGNTKTRHQVVVHCPTCNENRTADGVRNGGQRLVQEILRIVRATMKRQATQQIANSNEDLKHVTISLLGNSLGGLYCRYAIARLIEQTNAERVLDGALKLHLNVFCTTASPHLGLSKHTYFPIPRAAEVGVAHSLGDTGRDLFRLNDLLKTMATSQEYLKPLEQFQKRIAYANAFGTDFPVPTATAAFLHWDSTYPHHSNHRIERQQNHQNSIASNDKGLVVAVFHTPNNTDTNHSSSNYIDPSDDLAIMSHCLDSLGWKKVFVDLRKEIPVSVNLSRLRRNTASSLSDDDTPTLQSLKTRTVVGSGEIAEATHKAPDLDRISWPLGHNMIVAFSRDTKCASFNKGGRPVVHELAREFMESIFAWEMPVEQ